MNIAELGQELCQTGKFISGVLGEGAAEYDVDAIADLLKEGGFALCPHCARWCHAEELEVEPEDVKCQECRDVAELYKIGARL